MIVTVRPVPLPPVVGKSIRVPFNVLPAPSLFSEVTAPPFSNPRCTNTLSPARYPVPAALIAAAVIALPLPVTFTVRPLPPSSVLVTAPVTVPFSVVAEPEKVIAEGAPPSSAPRSRAATSAVLIRFSVVVLPLTTTGATAVLTVTCWLLTLTVYRCP